VGRAEVFLGIVNALQVAFLGYLAHKERAMGRKVAKIERAVNDNSSS
jgi:hypothetical protein